MARKSRKHLQDGVQQETVHKIPGSQIYMAGIYARISMDERSNDSSIENQLALAEHFIATAPDINLGQKYVDRGFSSFDSFRPGFENMMYDIDHKIIDCIIVKDLSRFSRDYLLTGELLQKRFPSSGIRFISINDNYDSLHDDPTRVSLALSTLISFTYSRDISKKVHSVIAAKQKDGSYMPSKLPYGYQRVQDIPNPFWEIDHTASEIVQRIFDMAMHDMSAYAIAGKLNSDGIPAANSKYWSTGGFLRILRNETYIGTFITGKTRNEITDRIRSIPISRDQWIRHVHHHVPIIDETIFDAVQDKLNNRPSRFKKGSLPEDFFQGKVVCGLCGRKMRRKKSGNGSIYYICPNRSDTNCLCANKAKSETKIKKQVYESLVARILEVREYRNSMIIFERSHYYRNLEHTRKNQLDNLNVQLEHQEKLFQKLYEESISNKRWQSADSKGLLLHLAEVRQHLREQIGNITSEREEYYQEESSSSEKVQRYLHFEGIDSLTAEIVSMLIKKILVKMDNVAVVYLEYNNSNPQKKD